MRSQDCSVSEVLFIINFYVADGGRGLEDRREKIRYWTEFQSILHSHGTWSPPLLGRVTGLLSSVLAEWLLSTFSLGLSADFPFTCHTSTFQLSADFPPHVTRLLFIS